jgi:hypothetical protein
MINTIPVACLSGVFVHLFYYSRGYRVPQVLGILSSHLVAGLALLTYFVSTEGLIHGVEYAIVSSLSYLAALFASIGVYRIFFHPLRHIPGPLAAKLSKLYNFYLSRDGKMHIHQTAMVAKYGNIVRIGSRS